MPHCQLLVGTIRRLKWTTKPPTIDSRCALAECREPAGFWTPILHDPDDEAFVQLAVAAKVSCLVSHNLRHLAPARAVGVNLLAPRDFLTILRS